MIQIKIRNYKENINRDGEITYDILSDGDYSEFEFAFINKLNNVPSKLLNAYYRSLSLDELKGIVLEYNLKNLEEGGV